MLKIETEFTKMMNCSLPIIGAPMFLVSNEDMVVEISEAGGVGTVPALNYRPTHKFAQALDNIKKRTSKPMGVNIIVNKSNARQKEDLKISLDKGVDLFITSLGSPKEVIEAAHKNGAKVLCDVTDLAYAKKVQDLGADGVICVGTGAGGHAGPISPFVLIPWLKKHLQIPIIAAGGIADGHGLAAALSLGASGVSVGTRLIVSQEAQVDKSYKDAILRSEPTDIVLTRKISGTPASVINTEYIQKTGTELNWALDILKSNPTLKKYIVPLIHLLGMKQLEKAAQKTTWKQVWSAGQTVGLIETEKSCREIVNEIAKEYLELKSKLP